MWSSVVAEHLAQRLELGHVTLRRRGGVRVDVHDLGRLQVGAVQQVLQRRGDAAPVGLRLHDVVGVGGDALADRLGVDPGAARRGVLGGLQDDDAGALAEDEAVAGRCRRDARRPRGSSLFLDIAIMLPNAAMGSGWMAASVPPATTTSARPVRIISMA